MPGPTLRSWAKKGKVRARRQQHGSRYLWRIWADEAELERLRVFRKQPHRWLKHILE